ncbi:MAG: KUP/HAK/KT family potassium transporter, partial [Chloroflexota bacterium]|nr:KUP/HAK/KT family potassium transporter [Chloroflexota bacterium]
MRSDDHAAPLHAVPHGRYLLLLTMTALGVVYGDIGTSPLYALRECFYGPHAIALTPTNVFGVLSLIVWALILVVTVKYLIFVLRADNRGEGGILALTALATPIKLLSPSERRWLVLLGVFGAALLYGDGAITPAISVLSAVEGLNVATPFFAPYVIPITMVILVGLFLIQRHGTALVGRLFGPITLLWFAVLAILGVIHIADQPAILGSVNPAYAVAFFRANGWAGYLILGTVFLVVTGGEALYADMGHFGKRPIRLAWFTVVLPALLLNYFGQGALLLTNPEAAENPFYSLAPDWALYPLVILATMATVIASQALISGAFSITMQAVQLGFLPRMNILHTSRTEFGQVYIPAVNWLLMITCLLIVLGFRTSSNLAAAYGIAVTSTMAITTLIFYIVIVERWRWNRLLAGLLAGFLFVIDLAFLGANLIKIPQGGWFPLVLALFIFTIMSTWKKGRYLVAQRIGEESDSIEKMLQNLQANPPIRVSGTAIFLSDNPKSAPTALLTNLKYNKVLHDQVLVLTVSIVSHPSIAEAERVAVEPLGQGIYRVTVTYGFMEEPDVPKA